MNEWHKFRCELNAPYYNECKLIHRGTGDVWLELQKCPRKVHTLIVKQDYFRSPRGKELDEVFNPHENEHHRHICNMAGVWFYVNALRLNMGIEPMTFGEDHKDQALQLSDWIATSMQANFHRILNMYAPKDSKVSDILLNIPEGIRPPIDPKGVTFYEDPYLQGL